MTTNPEEQYAVQRRRFRFGMRTGLVVVAIIYVVSSVMGGLGVRWSFSPEEEYQLIWAKLGVIVGPDASCDEDVTSLHFFGNQLPPEIGNFTNLTRLHLADNRIADTSLEQIRVLKNLEYLDLRGTNVTKQAIADLEKALPNCDIISDF
ncbi:MAG: hypothetical protein ACI9HK_003209 [Pirellulaceae bacterium]|jgi:hypothetical protein